MEANEDELFIIFDVDMNRVERVCPGLFLMKRVEREREARAIS